MAKTWVNPYKRVNPNTPTRRKDVDVDGYWRKRK